MKFFEINKIVTHKNISIDEWVAIWLLVINGWAARDVEVVFDTTTRAGSRKQEMERLEKEGVIFIGTGRGMFDEHPDEVTKRPRKENECAATLLAKFMGIHTDPCYDYILKLAWNDDHGFGPKSAEGRLLSHFALPSFIKKMYQNDSKSFGEVRDIVFDILDENYSSQFKFYKNRDVCREGDRYELVFNGKKYPLLVVETDNDKAHEWAFAKMYCHLVLVIKSSGNWQLYSKRGSKVQDFMSLIAGRIKQCEAKHQEAVYHAVDLEKEGSLPILIDGKWHGMEEVFYFKAQGAIFNGSLTHDQKPTKLDPQLIPGIIEELFAVLNDQNKTTTQNIAVTSALGSRDEDEAESAHV